MFKNVAIKKAIKNTISPVLTVVNKLIPKNDRYILLHSANRGIEHNLAPLRAYLLDNGYDENNKIICGIESMEYAQPEYNVTYVTYMKSMMYFMRSKHVFYTTGQIPIKPSKKQIVVHLDHGTAAIKTAGVLTKINNGDEHYFTYYTAPSQLYRPIVAKELLCDEADILINDEPVIDVMLTNTVQYDLGDYDKVGLWAPTFRQSDYFGYDDSSESLLPMFEEEDYERINEVLKKCNMRLIVKLHSGQNLDKYKNLKFSNLDIWSDKDFVARGYELYRLMTQVDFIIADYSSVYLQFLLLDKPILFAIPDVEEYSEKRGFIFENIESYMPGPKMKSKEEFYRCIEDLAAGVDEYAQERQRVCDLIHAYKDPNNCKRCVEISQIKK